MDRILSGLGAIIAGACAIVMAVIGYLVKDKLEQLSEKADRSSVEELEDKHSSLAASHATLKEKYAELDKSHAVMLAENRGRDEKLDIVSAIVERIDEKVDRLLMRTPSRGLSAPPRS